MASDYFREDPHLRALVGLDVPYTEQPQWMAKILLLSVATEIKKGNPLQEPLATYMYEALVAIYQGTDPSVALGLQKPPHRPSVHMRDWKIFAANEYIRNTLNEKAAVAAMLIAEEFGIEASTVKRIVRKVKKQLNDKSFNESDQSPTQAAYERVISAITGGI